jgi:hypothetical protein
MQNHAFLSLLTAGDRSVTELVYFINKRYEAVTRLIGLPQVLVHSKAGVSKCFFVP